MQGSAADGQAVGAGGGGGGGGGAEGGGASWSAAVLCATSVRLRHIWKQRGQSGCTSGVYSFVVFSHCSQNVAQTHIPVSTAQQGDRTQGVMGGGCWGVGVVDAIFFHCKSGPFSWRRAPEVQAGTGEAACLRVSILTAPQADTEYEFS